MATAMMGDAELSIEEWVFELLQNSGLGDRTWVRPMDLGRPSSRVHYGLQRLIKRGLVERRPRRASERSFVYRLTDAGRGTPAT